MDKGLWVKILDFKIDNPEDEYGFVTRLAIENEWTLFFTESAILEYKKFMYLAANYNEMVSPSEIVDIVWHQHLIFTVSYDEFCKLISKKIEHIPSTHNAAEKEKFGKAKIKTKELYEINFGKQPSELWHFTNELDSLQLEKSKFNPNYKYLFQLIAFIIIPVLSYYLLKPILVEIGNPDFLIGYIVLCVLSFIVLDIYIRSRLNSNLRRIQSSLIITNLKPFELVYLQKNNMVYVIHGIINNLITNKKVQILKNNRLNLTDEDLTDNQYENCVLQLMNDYEPILYPQLIKLLVEKPIFKQIKIAVDKIRNHIYNSKKVQSLITFASFYLSIIISIGLSRMVLGFSRGIPIFYISALMLVLIVFAAFYLKRIKNFLFKKTIPSFYKNQILSSEQKQQWEWNYFVCGNILFATSFIPLTNYSNRNSSASGSGCGTSCGGGGSCGSSCGGGCGGCGGGD